LRGAALKTVDLAIDHPPDPVSGGAGAAAGGALSIGRGVDNDVVLDHPTVSRHHAVIESTGLDYFITDLGSRNGTRVNGRTVRERRPLACGDKIRFGQVRATFIVQQDASAPTLQQAGESASEPGVLFDCPCGTRLWAKGEAVGGLVECGTCRREVAVPDASAKGDCGETVAGFAMNAGAPQALAAPVETGTCSICQWQTTAEDQITACPSCGLTFHSACWKENCGCSAYGCPEVNVHAPVRAVRVDAPELAALATPPVVAAQSLLHHADFIDPARRVPLGYALLAASVVGGAIGLLAFGVPSVAALGACLVTLDRRPRERTPLVFVAVALSLLGAVAGAACSTVWWLGGQR
jgi:hypothetical protein